MKTEYSDAELAAIADWAETKEREDPAPDLKKSYGAIRQGIDWLIRARIKRYQKDLETAEVPMKVKVVHQ
jgi:hypothetical protein